MGHIGLVAQSDILIREIGVVGGLFGGEALQAVRISLGLGAARKAGNGGDIDHTGLGQRVQTEIEELVLPGVPRDGGQIHDLGRPTARGVAVAPAHVGVVLSHVHRGTRRVIVLGEELTAGSRYLGAVEDDREVHVHSLGGGGGQIHVGVAVRSRKAGEPPLHDVDVHDVDVSEGHAVREIHLVVIVQQIPVVLIGLVGDGLLVGGEANDGLDVHVLPGGGQIQHIHTQGGILVAARRVGHVEDHGIPLARDLIGALDHGIGLFGDAHAAVGGVEAELGLGPRHGGAVHHHQILHLVTGAGRQGQIDPRVVARGGKAGVGAHVRHRHAARRGEGGDAGKVDTVLIARIVVSLSGCFPRKSRCHGHHQANTEEEGDEGHGELLHRVVLPFSDFGRGSEARSRPLEKLYHIQPTHVKIFTVLFSLSKAFLCSMHNDFYLPLFRCYFYKKFPVSP